MSQVPGRIENYTDYLALCDRLEALSRAYYEFENPAANDAEYDELMRLLLSVEEEHPEWKTSYSPSVRVGSPVSASFAPVHHDPPMLSLDNAMSLSECEEFLKRMARSLESEWTSLPLHIEPKFDGLAVELRYSGGIFFQGLTRGDGSTGEDITNNLRTVGNVPLRIPETGDVRLRGEVVMTRAEFLRVNAAAQAAGTKTFANPRNAASGALRQKDSRKTAERKLTWYPYALISDGREGGSFSTQSEIWKHLKDSWNIMVSDIAVSGTWDTVVKTYEDLGKKRDELPFDIDGLVIKSDVVMSWSRLGYTTRAPRWAIALKFPARSGITLLNSIIWQTGRTRIITPVGELAPVNVGGVVISRATLHNADELLRLGVCPGDKVEVVRAGDVIPKIASVVSKGPSRQQVSIPDRCPACESPVVREDVALRCSNPRCPGASLALLQYSVSRDGLDIDGLGDEWIARLFQAGVIRDLADVYGLNRDTLLSFEGMGDVLCDKILSAIEIRRKVPFHVFLTALGIPNVGGFAAGLLAAHYPDASALAAADEKSLMTIHGLGPVIARSVCLWFSDAENTDMLQRLKANGFSTIIAAGPESDQLAGQTFVFTGTLQTCTRAEAEEKVKSLGGRAAGSVSSRTTYVVAGEEAGSKLEKARALGITILSEPEFRKLVGW